MFSLILSLLSLYISISNQFTFRVLWINCEYIVLSILWYTWVIVHVSLLAKSNDVEWCRQCFWHLENHLTYTLVSYILLHMNIIHYLLITYTDSKIKWSKIEELLTFVDIRTVRRAISLPSQRPPVVAWLVITSKRELTDPNVETAVVPSLEFPLWDPSSTRSCPRTREPCLVRTVEADAPSVFVRELFVLSWLRNRRSWRRFSLRNRERRARSKKHQSIQILLYIFVGKLVLDILNSFYS